MLELNKIYNIDCLEGLKKLDDNSIDSIVTDPPYGLGFMGKEWDTFDSTQHHNLENEKYKLGGFKQLPRYRTDGLYGFTLRWAIECLRVLKPGGHLLSFAGTRTYHKIASAIDDAGFEIRDQIQWIYGSGFPKSLNIGKAIDKLQGTSEFEGWGTALKPANEPICVARKPLSEKTVAQNVLKWGTGGINIDDCRIKIDKSKENDSRINTDIKMNSTKETLFGKYSQIKGKQISVYKQGRFPSNIILDEEAGRLLDEQSGGGVSRFFYCAKASKSERNQGLDGFEEKQYSYDGRHKEIENAYQRNKSVAQNNHPTVKPVKLMEYLVRLVTPKEGVVLDPFMGSGTTGMAAKNQGFNYIGFDMTAEYCKIAEARIKSVDFQKRLF